MSLILHLSDMHLASIERDQLPDDHKWDIVPPRERPSHSGVLRETLTQLAQQLTSRGKSLAAIVVSGDITVSYREDGFEKFDEVLGWLGPARPPAEKIVVVPGNHDVMWGASDPAARYGHFIKYVRDRGYITPFLEDIDLKDGSVPASVDKHILASPDGKWAIIPINSSHYCGRIEPLEAIPDVLWSQLPDALAKLGANRNEVEKALKHLRLHDVARISTAQLNAVRSVVTKLREARGSGEAPTLIAVLHHQLLPVNIREEFKPFESLTNLGHFRMALRENGFSVVLHGHKHTEQAYYDYIHRLPNADLHSPHRVFVVSANAAKLVGNHPEAIGRLIEIPDSSTVAITSLPPVEAGTNLQLGKASYFPIWQPFAAAQSVEPGRPIVIEGDSFDQVYERALSVFFGLDPDALVPNVICRLTKRPESVELPTSYPIIEGITDRKQWFETLVEWWQKKDFKRLSGVHHFNHGHRIYAYAKQVDQISDVVTAISNAPLTSRAVITLLRPGVDGIKSDAQFPSFCFVQFAVRDCGAMCLLEAVAYFRKQEIKYWWPINVAELCRLQKEVFDRVKAPVKEKTRKSLALGPITTIAAMAAAGQSIPNILVPPLDFDLEQDSQKLWDMTYALCSTEVRNKRDYAKIWSDVLGSLVPPPSQNPTGVPVPIQSVAYLADISSHFAAHHDQALQRLSQHWTSLAEINSRHAGAMNQSKLSDVEHSQWRKQVLSELNAIRIIINSAFDANIAEIQ